LIITLIISSVDRELLTPISAKPFRNVAILCSSLELLFSRLSKSSTALFSIKAFPAIVPVTLNWRSINQSLHLYPVVRTKQFLNRNCSSMSRPSSDSFGGMNKPPLSSRLENNRLDVDACRGTATHDLNPTVREAGTLYMKRIILENLYVPCSLTAIAVTRALEDALPLPVACVRCRDLNLFIAKKEADPAFGSLAIINRLGHSNTNDCDRVELTVSSSVSSLLLADECSAPVMSVSVGLVLLEVGGGLLLQTHFHPQRCSGLPNRTLLA